MKVMIIGGGGREHALAWKIKQDNKDIELYAWPGNAGISKVAHCVLSTEGNNISLIRDFVKQQEIDLTVVGPEAPLAAGIVDQFQQQGLAIFGPIREAARIETSKVWAKNLMRACLIPTANYQFFGRQEKSKALKSLQEWRFPLVIKTDGLMSGKGVKICFNMLEAIEFIGILKGDFLIEEYLKGQELSFIAFCDGKTVLPLLLSQDYKQLYPGGPMTGGMGAYAPVDCSQKLYQKIIATIIPIIDGLRKMSIKYTGILYAGLMIRDGEPYVLEFNCRFGDPETQPLMMLLETDLIEIIQATLKGELDNLKLKWKPGAATCVVAACSGYPLCYESGRIIYGLGDVVEIPDVEVFHAGTMKSETRVILTDGGRILNVCAYGQTQEKSHSLAYEAIENIFFKDMQYRQDIGRLI